MQADTHVDQRPEGQRKVHGSGIQRAEAFYEQRPDLFDRNGASLALLVRRSVGRGEWGDEHRLVGRETTDLVTPALPAQPLIERMDRSAERPLQLLGVANLQVLLSGSNSKALS